MDRYMDKRLHIIWVFLLTLEDLNLYVSPKEKYSHANLYYLIIDLISKLLRNE